MATSIQTSRWLATTDELFREWGKAVSDGIRAVGLIQTDDTGQIDWETVTAPTTAATAAGIAVGYEIWRFDDALQATHPVVIKLEYGAGAGATPAANSPYMWVTIGRATNGAGSITGTLAPRRLWCGTGTITATAGVNQGEYEPIYVSSDGSSLCVVPRNRDGNAPHASFHTGAFVIDRSRDAAGNPTAAGGVILTEGVGQLNVVPSSSVTSAQMHAWTYSGDYTMGDVPAVIPNNVNSTSPITAESSLANGDRAPVFPYIVTVPNHEPWQVLAAVAVAAGDAANGPFTATTLGRLRNYRSIPVNQSHGRWATGYGYGYSGLCILWED